MDMVWWRVGLVALSACGRIAFDPIDDSVVPLGHDEDDDGVPDASDVCPHLRGSQVDGDRDGVGDDCDPNPMVARDTIALFKTMLPGDLPAWTSATGLIDHWVPGADEYLLTGNDPSGELQGSLNLPLTVGDVRIALGIDVFDRIEPAVQKQIAVGIATAPPYFYGEVNEIQNMFRRASVTLFDGTDYIELDPTDLAAGIHQGALFFQVTARVGTGVRFDAAWSDETYVSEVTDPTYVGGDRIELNVNNLHLQIRYLVVITSS